MTKPLKCAFYVFLMCLCFTIRAQRIPIFTQYTPEDGLEQRTIRKIIQDQKGFIWLATWDGLSRFDGHTFQNYKNTISSFEPSFISNRISFIAEDAFGCIWALGYDKRISRFNPNTDRLTPVLENDWQVRRFFTLSNGHTWVVTENQGLLLMKTDKEDYSLHNENISQKANIPFTTNVNLIFLDKNQKEWILTEKGIYTYSEDKSVYIPFVQGQAFTDVQETSGFIYFSSAAGQIWKYNKSTQTYEIIQLPVKNRINTLRLIDSGLLFCGTGANGFFLLSADEKHMRHYNTSTSKGMPDNIIRDVYVDKKGEVWIRQESTGVTHLDPKTGLITHFVLKDKSGNSITGSHQEQIIVEDDSGNLYVHPSGGGFAYYDRLTHKLVPVYNKQLIDGWHESDMIMDIYQDRQGNIWISSFKNGLEKITFKQKQFNLYSSPGFRSEQVDTRAVYIDKDNRLWFGSKYMGVGIYSAERKFLGYLQADGTLSKSGSDFRIMAYSITQDHEGTIWIGTKKSGVISAKPNDKAVTFKLKHFRFKRDDIYSISNDDVWQIYEDSHKRLWFTTWNGGINYLDRRENETYRFINYRNQLKNYPIQTCGRARSITTDNKGNLWIATADGLLVFDENFTDPSKVFFKQIKHIPNDRNSLNNNDIQYLYLTTRRELYIATFGGGMNKLISYNNGVARFKSYTKEDGLLSNILLSMIEDRKGNIWISMVEGLSKFLPGKESFENYTEREFLESIRFNDGAGCYSQADNLLLFNTAEGLLSFDPDEVHKPGYIPPIVFTRLQMGNYQVMPGDSTGILQTNVNDTGQITLIHSQNSFSIHFAALDMTDPQNISYAYRLRGFEDNWHQSDKNYIANYTNIPKGDYVFEVRSTNSDGIWVDNVRQLPVKVLPSFWESNWGILLYIVIGIAILSGLFIYYRLRQKVKLEQKLSELKLQFFTNISHELRTPLTLISAPVKNVLEQDNLHPDVRNQLQLVDRNTDRMNLLVNQILDFRKIQNRKMELRVQSFDLIAFVSRLMGFFEGLAEKRQIDFSLETSFSSYTIWADTDKLEKVLFNLISNAFKYTPEGKQIKIAIEESDKNIRISINDQGIGIEKSEQKRLFNRFETISSTQFIDQAGTGIGLSLVKELVEMHGGSIYIDSEPGKGSAFIITLKQGKGHFDKNNVVWVDEELSINRGTANAKSFIDIDGVDKVMPEMNRQTDTAKKTVLIVEDNNELRYFLRTIFETEFYILEAENGSVGLNIARAELPDVIISDIMMPEMDGIELLRALRLDLSISHIPVVLLTAKSSVENRIIGIELGADDYITKPFNAYYLKARIMGILQQREKLQHYYSTLLFSENREDDILAGSPVTESITSNNQMFMKHLIESVDKNLGNGNLTIEDLAQETGMSRSIFFKKVKNLTGLSPVEFLKDIRMKRAAGLIKCSDLTMSQIAFHVGFNDAHYFSKCFKQKFGITPTEYREGKEPLFE